MTTSNSMIQTHNDLSAKIRTLVATLLNERLADALDLYSHAKQAHWNVRGPGFIAIHELFDKISEETLEYGDLIAERAGQLGSAVRGLVKQSAQASSLPDYEPSIAEPPVHVEALSRSLAHFAASIRQDIETTDDAGDSVTSDLLTQIGRSADKLLWMLESNLAPVPADAGMSPNPRAKAKA